MWPPFAGRAIVGRGAENRRGQWRAHGEEYVPATSRCVEVKEVTVP